MPGEVTEWLRRWRGGDREALERVVPLVYDQLRQIARRQLLGESPGHTLSATALVHEVYLRLLQQRQLTAEDRDGFLAIAARTMRRILVDHARARTRLKRGGHERTFPLETGDDVPLLSDTEVEEVLAMDRALERLAQIDERAHRVVECRVFAGLTLDETAKVLQISGRSVQRTWTAALAWLRKEIGHDVAAP
jgi:RNA polymerase sigma factor (TIGR02999 family)